MAFKIGVGAQIERVCVRMSSKSKASHLTPKKREIKRQLGCVIDMGVSWSVPCTQGIQAMT